MLNKLDLHIEDYVWAVHALVFVVTLLFSLLINGIFIKFASTLGIRDKKNTVIRWTATSKPSVGGLSFYILFLFLFLFSAIFSTDYSFLSDIRTLGILSVGTIAFLMGLADDAYDTKPIIKFLVQILIGVILIFTNNYIQIFSSNWANYGLTFFWVIGIMNSINMLDNMDAITTQTSIFILLNILLILCFKGFINSFYFILIAGNVATLLGFLRYNWHPSKIFMGDTGSQFLGVVLAVLSIDFVWNDFTTSESFTMESKQLVLVVNIFLLPIIDTTTVFINRIKRGQSPMIGGKDHTTHNLCYAGLNERQVALIFMTISVFTCFNTVVISHLIDTWSHVFTISYFVIFGAFLAFFLYLTNKYQSFYLS